MHPAVMNWLESVKSRRPGAFHGGRILECGSLDINGTPRPLFSDCEYIGIDWRAGPGVDVVSLVHQYFAPHFDVVISTEMLEHDPYWVVSIASMVGLLHAGGDMLLTFGGRLRAAHEVDTSPVEGYYRGLESCEVYGRLFGLFDVVHIWDDENDVYMWCEGKK